MQLLQCPKAPVLEHPSTVNVFTCPKHCWNLHCSPFIPILYKYRRKWVGKHVLVICEVLRLFRNTLTADHMYFGYRWEKFLEQDQMVWSEKQKTFSQNFIACLKSALNFAQFEKKDQLHGLNILEFLGLKIVVTSMPESSCFRTPFQSQGVHGSQKVQKPTLQNFYGNSLEM